MLPERPLRVALVSHTARMGGAEFALLQIAERIDRHAVAPVAVLGEEGPLADHLHRAGVEVLVRPLDARIGQQRKDDLGFAGLVRPVLLARTAVAVIGLARTFRRRGFDVVHTNSLKAHLLGGVAGRLAGARVVWHVRDHLAQPYLPAAAVRAVRLAARIVPHRVVAVSASAARTVGRADVAVIHQGVALPDLHERKPPDGRLRVGLVGRIAPWKGQDVFIDAAARLAGDFPEAEFLIVGAPLFGEDAFEASLHRRVADAGLGERVRFLGFRDDIWDVYRGLDVAVHASTQAEPYGNVILEAMASATPLVAAGEGGVLELVDDGRTGLLVEPGDADALAAAVARLLRSPEERRRLGAAGRRHAEANFSLDRDAAEIARLWLSHMPAAQRRRDAGRAAGVHELRSTVRRELDRPGRRWLLGALGSLRTSSRQRQPCLIRWRDDAWIHHFRDATIPHPMLGEGLPFERFTAEARDISLHEYTPREGDVVFDVGAGVGTATLLYSRLVGPTGRVIALEAHPGTYSWLDRLCQLNGLTNVIRLQVAASAAAGEVAITDLDEHVGNTVLAGDDGCLKVPARPLDDIAATLAIAQIDFVKMNIEGAEQLAIRGMTEMIARTRRVCISCHDFLADRGGAESMRTKAAVRAFLLANGFRLTSRDDARDPWTRDYLYGTNTRVGDEPAGGRS